MLDDVTVAHDPVPLPLASGLAARCGAGGGLVTGLFFEAGIPLATAAAAVAGGGGRSTSLWLRKSSESARMVLTCSAAIDLCAGKLSIRTTRGWMFSSFDSSLT